MNFRTLLFTIAVTMFCAVVQADVIPATPDNYKRLLRQLEPGDVLKLEAGTYRRLTLRNIHGTPEEWITITGPTQGEPAVIIGEAGYNTVQLYGSSYVAIKNLTVNVNGLPVDAINAKQSISHHILIENNILRGFPINQQVVGINTKSTAFNWTIRGNTIIEAGTGIYLGNSNGNAPFIAGRVENNIVVKPLGYCMQIKHQNSYQPPKELELGPHTTLIRHNVFIKDDRKSPDGNRPNLLVGGFPEEGPGSDDHYEIYGNLFYHNPRESLFQGTGRILIHDNTFAGAGEEQTAILVRPHEGKPVKIAHVYDNTIYGGARGIRFGAAAQESGIVMGNRVFADNPISGYIEVWGENVVGTLESAPDYDYLGIDSL
ncbi:hypothetical protein [Nitrosococcus wardiae]|uniref:Right handed beta helix domain-containing protein n=1 Tax=Nitrosococcus wardiae TaxID=1814290 RepID=A0A4P7BXN6_9GAMM|nr:hypothetical protein [Nitrosococcus wardiae]QBQ53959.1 hypothetical protein E3U44_05105 [Nitrosococcus wardiae]